MKKTFLLIALLISNLCIFSQSTIDKIIAVIGTEIILQSDLEKVYSDYKAQYVDFDNEDEIICYVLENMVYNKLMMHQAEIDSVVFTEDQVDDQVNYRMAMIIQHYGGDAKIIEKYYNKSIDEIKKDMREMMYEQMVVEQMQANLTQDITITPSEVKSYISKFPLDSMPVIPPTYEFGHIVKTPPISDEERQSIKDRLEGYRERVLRGEKFSMLARLYSDDPGSASKGGNLGFVERGVLYPEFEAVAFSLKTGEISQVVETQAGYHIIMLNERRGDAINVSHILIQPKPSADEQIKAIEYLDSIKVIIDSLDLEFSDAAMRFSTDDNKNSGGWVVNPYTNSFKFDKESLEPATRATLDQLIPGEYSEAVPFVTEDGLMSYRLLYLRIKVPEHKANLVEDYDVIKNAALEEKKGTVLQNWIKKKVKITSIKIDEKYRDCNFVKEWQIPE